MGKTTYVICAVNMIASALALFLIFRSPGKPHTGISPTPGATVHPAKAPLPEEAWSQFHAARTPGEAQAALAALPSDAETLRHLQEQIVQAGTDPTGDALDFTRISRGAACIQALAARAGWASDHRVFLEKLAQNRRTAVVLRDLALRGVVDIALRRQQSASSEGDAGWREELKAFLARDDFGAETSIEGLALQAMTFLKTQGVADVGNPVLTERITRILDAPSAAQESTLITALETCASLSADEHLTNAIRVIASTPRSDAVFQAAATALGRLTGRAELEKLGASARHSAPTYRVLETVWTRLGDEKP
jgi:hypothetical protein